VIRTGEDVGIGLEIFQWLVLIPSAWNDADVTSCGSGNPILDGTPVALVVDPL
ncbi:uncharacterized protein METZ01_LOCUS239996, partial [marine metagenome]